MIIKFDTVEWHNWLITKGLSKRSRSEYILYLEKLSPINLSQGYFINFLSKHNNQVARAALQNILIYIRTCDEYNLEIQQLARNIELPKVTGRKKKRSIEPLSESEVYQISNYMERERDKLCLFISFYGALRVSEIVGNYAIQPYSFNWRSWLQKPENYGHLKIIGKGNKEAVVFIPQKIMARTYQYILNYASVKQNKSDPLFKIGVRRWTQVLAKASKKALGKSIHPHILRHSAGEWLRSYGWDINDIKDYMRHEDVRTTANIYMHKNQERLKTKFKDLLSNSETDSILENP